jgi:hypothetical protein
MSRIELGDGDEDGDEDCDSDDKDAAHQRRPELGLCIRNILVMHGTSPVEAES